MIPQTKHNDKKTSVIGKVLLVLLIGSQQYCLSRVCASVMN